jgi:predicted PurR-regulated permease PerM
MAKRMPRNVAILLIYLAIIVLIALIFAVFIPPIVAQVRQFVERVPDILERTRQLLADYGITDVQIDSLTASAAQIGQRLIGVPFSLLSGVLDGVLVLIISLYLLMDVQDIQRFILSLFGGERRERVASVGQEMLRVSGGYVRGVAINMLLVGTVTTIGLTIIGVPFALVLGLIAGLFEALPVVGSLIGAVPIMLIAVLQSPGTALITLIFILIVQQVQGNIITPNVMNEQAAVPRYLVPLVIVAGATVGGIVGALISVPLTAVLRVFVLRVIAPVIRRQTGAAETLE